MKKIRNNWFCIYTNANEEHIAFNELLLKGLKIYFPRYKRTIKHARRSQEKIFSLFPRYFFALENENVHFSSINRTRGVSSYLHNDDGSPITVKQEVIDFIKSREDSNGYIQLNNERFSKGDKLVLTRGIFSSLKAIFLKQCNSENARIVIEFMGREHVLPTPLEYLDRQY